MGPEYLPPLPLDVGHGRYMGPGYLPPPSLDMGHEYLTSRLFPSPQLVLIPSGDHRNTYDCQAGGTHVTGILSCGSNNVLGGNPPLHSFSSQSQGNSLIHSECEGMFLSCIL